MRTSLSAAATALLLSACGTTPAPQPKAVPASPAPPVFGPSAPALQAQVVTPVQTPSAPLPEAPSTQPTPQPDTITALLTHAERMRGLNTAELAAEIALQGDPGLAPLRQMQLALALMHSHQAVDTARSLGLLQRVLGAAAPEATPLKPLARLLAQRLLEQRRLEDTAERQGQQLRDNQRRIEQLTERLEAMRAIERSLTTRPPTAPNSTRAAP